MINDIIESKDILYFNSDPIESFNFNSNILNLPTECCELIFQFILKSETIYSLLKQLGLLNSIDCVIIHILDNDIRKYTLNLLSIKSKTNFLIIKEKLYEDGYYIDLIDNKYNKTMIIDRDYQLFNIDINILLDENNISYSIDILYAEYSLSYTYINEYKLSKNETFFYHFNYDNDKEAFDNYTGTRYDAAIFASIIWSTGVPYYPIINENQPISLIKFIIYLLKRCLENPITIIVIIIDKSYYVLGKNGHSGFTILDININGDITIPNISLNELLNNYHVGKISDIPKNIMLV